MDDSLPARLLHEWTRELESNKTFRKNNLGCIRHLERQYYSKIEKYLDTNSGDCWLKDPAIASIVAGALRYFDGNRYYLHTWIIMPNHVHVLFTIANNFNLTSKVHSWKSFTAHQANRVLQRSGRFWQPEYFERQIRSERHFEFCIRYILNNPVKAGLSKEPFEWPWYGCSSELQKLLDRFF